MIKKLLFRMIDFFVKPTTKCVSLVKGVGAVQEFKDERDFLEPVSGTAYKVIEIDKRESPFLSRVESQGLFNSCVSHSITTCLEYLSRKDGFPGSFELSRMDLYNNGRKRTGTFPRNEGMSVREAWKSAQKDGVTLEKLFPYISSNFNKLFGRSFVFNWYPRFRYVFISDNLKSLDKKNAIIKVLEEKDMILCFAMGITKSFLQHKGQKVFIPSSNEAVAYYHAMTVIGYSSSRSAFLVRNSWGEKWGFKGDAWIDEKTFLEKAYSISYAEAVD